MPTKQIRMLPTQRTRILIVDDVPDNIQVLAKALGSEYEVIFATSGAKALEIVDTQQPHLILLDVVMPEMDGFQVLEALKADHCTRKIPVIFVTAHQGTEAETAALDAGAVDFIPKPINPNVARARVRTHVKLARRTQELEALSLRYKKMADNFRELSIHDELTGLYNRHHLEPLLRKEVAHAERERSILTVAMLDLDNFKWINDHYGHAVGDLVLAETGHLLKERLRESDTAFRYGGEEFLLVLPDTTTLQAHLLCDELRKLFESHSIGKLDVGKITVSIGIAGLGEEKNPWESAIVNADLALYQAKRNGRNRVELYQPPVFNYTI